MYGHPKRRILADMDKTQLLNMREQGMSNEEIANAVGCGYQTIYRAIGKQPPEITKRRLSDSHVYIPGTGRGEKLSEGGVYRAEESAEYDAAA